VAGAVSPAVLEWAHEVGEAAGTEARRLHRYRLASADELVLRCAGGRFPIITGVEFGHQERKIGFPIGCRVEFGLRGHRPVMRYLEDLVTLDT